MTTTPAMPDQSAPPAAGFDWLRLARGLAGAIAGGVAGYFLFRWLGRQGFLTHMLPGVLMGLGAGWAARGRSLALGVICGVAALMLGVFCEWMRAPFVADPSFSYFVTHLAEMDGAALKLVTIGLGAAAAFWFGQGR